MKEEKILTVTTKNGDVLSGNEAMWIMLSRFVDSEIIADMEWETEENEKRLNEKEREADKLRSMVITEFELCHSKNEKNMLNIPSEEEERKAVKREKKLTYSIGM